MWDKVLRDFLHHNRHTDRPELAILLLIIRTFLDPRLWGEAAARAVSNSHLRRELQTL